MIYIFSNLYMKIENCPNPFSGVFYNLSFSYIYIVLSVIFSSVMYEYAYCMQSINPAIKIILFSCFRAFFLLLSVKTAYLSEWRELLSKTAFEATGICLLRYFGGR